MATKNTKKENYKDLWKNPRARTSIIIVSAVLGGVILWSVIHGNQHDTPAQLAGSSTVPNAPNVNTTPGSSTDPNYNALVDKSNNQKIQQAQQSGGSVLPVATNSANIDKTDPFDKLNNDNVQKVEAAPKPVTAPPVVQPVVQQQTQPQQIQQAAPQQQPVNNTQSLQSMDKQLAMYMAAWQPHESMQEISFKQNQNQNQQGGQNGQANVGGNNGNVQNNGQQTQSTTQNTANTTGSQTQKGAAFVRAGTIVPAVMMTAINSDEPGPVLAEIVTGPLKGARLIGELKSADQTVTVQFTQLSMPGALKTYQINTYAVDPNSARTGLATDVNNHYFLRYGLQLAAAFITGYGQAVQNMGSTTTTSALGGTTTTYGSLSHKQISESALGSVGETLGQNLKQDSNRAPTVTVDSGTSVGILFMADF